ncbi:hypothetical protein [Parabacteroides sp. FAFU027]|uniref:hypothetical protein n=1 Tax=Parabacteroides sp. FAFU027 TaxID=2922715 RepID=UPI001FAEEEC5|nr:hypothetical protein [Parabacteroides sp. FAFU027]
MKLNKVIKYTLVFIVFCIAWNLIGDYIEKSFRKNVYSKRKMYCYERYHKGTVNPVLYVEDKMYWDSLITYYRQIEHGNMNPVFNFPVNEMPYDTCVYIMGYEHDSLIADVICYYDWGRTGTYRRGYVYRNTLHSDLPPKKKTYNKMN